MWLKGEIHMRKYEICTNDFQIRCGTKKSSIPSYTAWELYDEANYNDCYAYELQASFDTQAEAREFFDKHYKDYGRTWAEKGNVFWILRGRLAWIEIDIYDENGEFDSYDGTIELSAEPYKGEEN